MALLIGNTNLMARAKNFLAVAVLVLMGALAACRDARSFTVRGVVKELKPESRTVMIQHEEIPGYMPAMVMPFRVKSTNALAGLQAGDQVVFHLFVTANESWIDQLNITGRATNEPPPASSPFGALPLLNIGDRVPDAVLTNQSGQTVRFSDFRGQAFALTFFFTRCPLPEYCPRLMQNFAEAQKRLGAMPNAPTNWHLLAISFDTAFDSPVVLKVYAARYLADPKHWSFATGSTNEINRLARLFGMEIEPDGVSFNHNFRTIVVDAQGRMQALWPIGGDTSETLVSELIKAAAAR